MRKFVLLTLVVAIAVVCLAAGPTMPSNYSRNVTFVENVKVGDVTLKAGEYKVVHQMQGDNHVMVFMQGKKEAAKVNCTIENLTAKADRSEQYFLQENGAKTLKALIFRGDTIRHNF